MDIALSTITRTWYSRQRDAETSTESFRFGYQLLTPVKFHAEVREFASAEERAAFIKQGITDWQDRPRSASVMPAWSPAMTSWPGSVLESAEVEAVAETLVLGIAGELARLELLPECRTSGGVITATSPGYLQALQALVGQLIKDVDVFLDDGLVIQFADAELIVSTARIWDDPWQGELEWAIGGYTIPPQPDAPT